LDEFYKMQETQIPGKFTLVCLGSLTSANIANNKYPSVFKQIDKIVWYNTSANPLTGFNYECDTTAALDIIKNGKVRIDIVTNPHKTVLFDRTCYALAQNYQNKLSEIIHHIYNQPILEKNLTHADKTAADELVPMYLLAPELFMVNLKFKNTRLRWVESFETEMVKEMLGDLITGKYTGDKSVVFNEFPAKREMFNYDVRQILDSAIKKYGHDEWKACVMTDEFHGHLGVFSIVGAKMGIKAREIFGVGPDQLSVQSFAGLRPPYSCLTDGIQVSTGATLGQGLIKVSSDSITRPSAIFSYKGRSVRITLKSEYLKMVDSDIETGIVKFGLSDDGYWKLVRKAALNYWLNWSRNEIFEIEECKQ
jgi:pyrimidine-specific ribonucleoside hydrolase